MPWRHMLNKSASNITPRSCLGTLHTSVFLSYYRFALMHEKVNKDKVVSNLMTKENRAGEENKKILI